MKLEKLEKYLADRFSVHIKESFFDNDKWNIIYLDSTQQSIDMISEKYDAGYKIKVGWVTTSVRGFHNYVLAWRKK